MLAIRMQRTGRRGHAMFRMVVQDARRTPTSGKIVAYLGSYDPHSKKAQINKEQAGFFLEHGAQPSPRAVKLLKEEKIKLPKWVEEVKQSEGAIRHPEKRRSTRPEDAAEPVVAEKVETVPVEEEKSTANESETVAAPDQETPVVESADTPPDETPSEA